MSAFIEGLAIVITVIAFLAVSGLAVALVCFAAYAAYPYIYAHAEKAWVERGNPDE